MLYIMNYNIKEYKVKEFQKFIKESEKTLSEHAPKGWKYLGTYFYVLGFGPYAAAQMWEISKFADLDNTRSIENVLREVIEQMNDLCTSEPNPSWLLREVGDTSILEPKKKT